jgi:hypothetical protein
MKTLLDVVRATEMRYAKTIITTAQGSPKLTGCFLITTIPGSDTKVQLTDILLCPDYTVSDVAFAYYLADLDDSKTWLSAGVEQPRLPVKKEA